MEKKRNHVVFHSVLFDHMALDFSENIVIWREILRSFQTKAWNVPIKVSPEDSVAFISLYSIFGGGLG
jgi:hypothetical protein